MSRLPGTVLIVLLALTAAASAQRPASPGTIRGSVVDDTGGVLVAVHVEARSLGAAVAHHATSDASGRFELRNIPPGRYAVSASAPGFKSATRGTVVTAAAPAIVDLVLGLAPVDVRVEVTAHNTSQPLRVETDPKQPRQPIPAHDGADYLKTIPGFAVIRKGGSDGDPILRGMAGSRLGILLDGQNLLGGCSSRMDPPTAYVFPDAYDRITVLKGPQSVANGPGQSAGVVLFEREHRTAPGLGLYAAPTFGSFGRNDQAASARVTAERAYVRASMMRSSMGDYRDGRGGSVHSTYERWSADTAIGWTPDADTLVEGSTAFSDGQAAYADRRMDGARFARQNLGLRVERRNLSPLVYKVEAQAYYNYVDHVMDNYSRRPFTPTMAMPSPSASNPDRRTRGGRAVVGLTWAGTTTADLGLDWQGNRHSARGSSNQLADPFEGKARVRDAVFSDVGLFGELTHALGPRQRVIGGARLDRWSARDARATIATGIGKAMPNPTAHAARREMLPSGFGRYERELLTGTTAFAGVGHTQRTPDYWELIGQQGAISLSAFGVGPEKTTQLDTGLLYRGGLVSGSVSVFTNRIDDFLLVQSNYVRPGTGGMTASPATVTRNVEASSWGGEATVAASLAARLTLDGSVAYVHGDNRTDRRPLAQLPPLDARVGLQYAADRWSVGGLTRVVAAQTRYALNQGNIVGQDLGPTPAFAIVSLSGRVRVHRLASVSMGVDNLLDETYAEFVSRSGAAVTGFPTTTRVNEPGRTLWVKVDFRR